MKKKLEIKKSQILIFGSFLILVGVIILFSGHLKILKEEVYENARLNILEKNTNNSEEVIDSSNVSNLTSDTTNNSENNENLNSGNNSTSTAKPRNNFKYDYIGYLEIPKIKLKRGFLSKESKYNDINYNIMVSYNADYPDVVNGNFILVAHSGDAYISFFAYLYKLNIGDTAIVTYNGSKYNYKLVKIEEQPKTGVIAIHRPNYQVNGLTLITCTKNNDFTQTIYIFELV